MKLSGAAFDRAKSYLKTAARPLERARFEHEFEAAPSEVALRALEPFRNQDGGFGHGLEPDLWMPASSVLCTIEALHVLHELGVPTTHDFVGGAVDWLVAALDPELCAWRHVTEEAEAYPHAAHWKWELHADGSRTNGAVCWHSIRCAHCEPTVACNESIAITCSDVDAHMERLARCCYICRVTKNAVLQNGPCLAWASLACAQTSLERKLRSHGLEHTRP